MATNRKVVFANGEIYHVFNRGVEKRTIFTNIRDFQRATETFSYYRLANPPLRFSHFIRLEKQIRLDLLKNLIKAPKHIEILAYCLMPNHFHFLLKQTNDKGISQFIANSTNSYTKYFNTKYKRVGPLLQGAFKAVHVDNDAQLIHVSRYIHLNPVSSFIVTAEELEQYIWSSYPSYLNYNDSELIKKKPILSFFKSINAYKQFVLDQADYAKTLDNIKHLTLD